MKKQDIHVGGHYTAKVSGKLVTVRVDAIRETQRYRRNNYSGQSDYSDVSVYDVTNLTTGRHTTFKSAAKFRYKSPIIASEQIRKSGSPCHEVGGII